MGYKQIGMGVGTTVDGATLEEFSIAIADKTHLANLITTLKSELASANALLKIKEKDYHDAKEQLKLLKGNLSDANHRVDSLEKQCENYRFTVSELKNLFDECCSNFFSVSKQKENKKKTFHSICVLGQTFGRSAKITFRNNQAA